MVALTGGWVKGDAYPTPGGVGGVAMLHLTIEGMTCGHCVANVKAALEAVSGVTRADVDLKPGKARVEGTASVQALCAAVAEEGYTARVSE